MNKKEVWMQFGGITLEMVKIISGKYLRSRVTSISGALAVSSRLVKKLVPILIIAGLFLAGVLGQPWQNAVVKKTTACEKLTVGGLKDEPSGLLEISQLTLNPANNCRQNNPDISIDHRSVTESSSPYFHGQNIAVFPGLTANNYLGHIYPSHNFW